MRPGGALSGDQFFARLDASDTGFAADLAFFMLGCVFLALLGAVIANINAHLGKLLQALSVGRRIARKRRAHRQHGIDGDKAVRKRWVARSQYFDAMGDARFAVPQAIQSQPCQFRVVRAVMLMQSLIHISEPTRLWSGSRLACYG